MNLTELAIRETRKFINYCNNEFRQIEPTILLITEEHPELPPDKILGMALVLKGHEEDKADDREKSRRLARWAMQRLQTNAVVLILPAAWVGEFRSRETGEKVKDSVCNKGLICRIETGDPKETKIVFMDMDLRVEGVVDHDSDTTLEAGIGSLSLEPEFFAPGLEADLPPQIEELLEGEVTKFIESTMGKARGRLH